jgi:hypothetical protein
MNVAFLAAISGSRLMFLYSRLVSIYLLHYSNPLRFIELLFFVGVEKEFLQQENKVFKTYG